MTTDVERTDFEKVGERVLMLCDNATGQRRPITIQIGRPYWVKSNIEAACPAAIEGLLERRSDIRGVDTFQALSEAIRFINNYLSESPKGYTVCWPDGSDYFP